MKVLATILLTAAVSAPYSVPHSTEDGAWKDSNGFPAANTDARKSIKGFGGWLLVTPDQDWARKWNTPSVVTPRFNEADTVLKGGELFVLIFFSNPGVASSGAIDVRCDLEVTRPDGSYSVQQRDVECARGDLKSPPNHVFLSAPVIKFVGEPKDQSGQWLVRVMLKDNVRGVSMPLKTSFVLKDG